MHITAGEWRTLRPLLEEALDLEPAARAQWLSSVVLADERLRAILCELIARGGDMKTIDVLPDLGKPMSAVMARELAVPSADDGAPRFEQYRVIGRLGRGSMGDVYLAEQDAPVRRHVALKVLRLGLSTHDVMVRFELERQRLAVMTHPHIARIFHAGATQEGWPYFALEYVPGTTISQYCDTHRLDVDARLR